MVRQGCGFFLSGGGCGKTGFRQPMRTSRKAHKQISGVSNSIATAVDTVGLAIFSGL